MPAAAVAALQLEFGTCRAGNTCSPFVPTVRALRIEDEPTTPDDCADASMAGTVWSLPRRRRVRRSTGSRWPPAAAAGPRACVIYFWGVASLRSFRGSVGRVGDSLASRTAKLLPLPLSSDGSGRGIMLCYGGIAPSLFCRAAPSLRCLEIRLGTNLPFDCHHRPWLLFAVSFVAKCFVFQSSVESCGACY